MNELSWAAVIRLVHERARNCCEYCQTSRDTIGQAMHVEHIDPNGGNMPENLCLACPSCNLSKATAIAALDQVTGTTVPLFNPRTQRWQDHFMWIENARLVQGVTSTGRATVERLRMNQDRLVVAHALWVKANCHPPSFDA
jgi:HNH endonuclease